MTPKDLLKIANYARHLELNPFAADRQGWEGIQLHTVITFSIPAKVNPVRIQLSYRLLINVHTNEVDYRVGYENLALKGRCVFEMQPLLYDAHELEELFMLPYTTSFPEISQYHKVTHRKLMPAVLTSQQTATLQSLVDYTQGFL
jgi:hypothetical protein